MKKKKRAAGPEPCFLLALDLSSLELLDTVLYGCIPSMVGLGDSKKLSAYMSLTFRVRITLNTALIGERLEGILLSGEEKALTLEAIEMFLALLKEAITDQSIVEETTQDVEKLRIRLQTAPLRPLA